MACNIDLMIVPLSLFPKQDYWFRTPKLRLGRSDFSHNIVHLILCELLKTDIYPFECRRERMWRVITEHRGMKPCRGSKKALATCPCIVRILLSASPREEAVAKQRAIGRRYIRWCGWACACAYCTRSKAVVEPLRKGRCPWLEKRTYWNLEFTVAALKIRRGLGPCRKTLSHR